MSERKIVKMLRNLNGVIDEDREKLCDRIRLLERSHKRLMRLLFLIDKLANDDNFDCEISYGIWKNQFYAVLQAVHDEVERKVL